LPTDKGTGTRLKRLRILVVEDEALVALLLEGMLIDLGHSVVGPVARFSKALEMAQREELDVAILDVNIHGQETYAVAEALAARQVPFVFATGYDPKRLREPYRDGPVLQKPYMQSDLQKMLGEVCR
jgi:CheY-like chemotaxis protein